VARLSKAVLPGFTTISSPVAGSCRLGNVFYLGLEDFIEVFCTDRISPAGRAIAK